MSFKECFNSPYGHQHFPEYAETIGFDPHQPYDMSQSKSQSLKTLSDMAKKLSTWILGGYMLV